MEITESMVYWITRLDEFKMAVKLAFLFGCIVTPILLAFISAMVCGYHDDELDAAGKALRKYLPIWIICGVLSISYPFIPTTKEMCAIKIIPHMASNEDVAEIPSEIAELAREWIEELKPTE